jgi:hypothetical protein
LKLTRRKWLQLTHKQERGAARVAVENRSAPALPTFGAIPVESRRKLFTVGR